MQSGHYRLWLVYGLTKYYQILLIKFIRDNDVQQLLQLIMKFKLVSYNTIT